MLFGQKKVILKTFQFHTRKGHFAPGKRALAKTWGGGLAPLPPRVPTPLSKNKQCGHAHPNIGLSDNNPVTTCLQIRNNLREVCIFHKHCCNPYIIYIYIGAKHIVVSGIFSTICVEQEVAVGEMIKTEYPEASVTLSHQVANFGLLERENSSILNESLKSLSKTAISAFTQAVKDAGLNCPVFFTQNDGTIIR